MQSSYIKKSIKGTGKRVVLQGRLGKDNPNAHKYSKNAPRAKYADGKRVNSDVSGKSGAHSHQRIQKADAAHHDVYVYDRNESVELDESVSFKRNGSDHVIHHQGKPVGRIVKTSSFGSTGYSVRVAPSNDAHPHLASSKHEVSDESSLKSAKESAKWHLTSSESPVKREAVELDEISKDLATNYYRKASKDIGGQARSANDLRGGSSDLKGRLYKTKPEDREKYSNTIKKYDTSRKTAERKVKNRAVGMSRASTRMEEVEQLAELSPNTLHSYIKKAAGNMGMHAVDHGKYGDEQKDKKSLNKAKKRLSGITSASGRMADKANMAENWQEEIPMMMRQLEFIAYAAEEIMDYVDMAGDPEEWFQNKISGIHQSMLSMYAYAKGGRRAGYGFDESVEVELVGGQKKLDHNKNGKIDAHDFKLMRAKKMKEEAELEEAAYMSGSSTDRAEAHHDQAQKHFDAAENAHSTSEASAHRYAARAHVKAGMSHERRAENPPTKTAAAAAAVSSHAHKLTQMAGRFDESVELEEAELDEISKNALMNYRTSAKIHRRQNDEIIGSQMASNKQVNKAEKDNVKRTKGIDMAAKKIATKESVELGEVTRSAVKRPVQYTDARGITRTKMTSTRPVQHDQHGQEKITESRAKRLDEAFAAGAEKLSDGSIVILKKQDADLLNNLFKDLNPANKKKMMKVAMTDKAGFNEILGFAREAL